MNYVIKLFPEINLKTASLRRRYVTALQINIHTILSVNDPLLTVEKEWDRLIVKTNPEADQSILINALSRIPGIQKFFAVSILDTFVPAEILNAVRASFGPKLKGKTFAVHVKRSGKHEFTSLELARQIGGALLDEFPCRGVDLDNPELLIRLEVTARNTMLIESEYGGLGGYPLGTQEEVLSLISGGFDSAVASMQFIKRGCKVHYCFFNLGGKQHANGVKEMALRLWQRYGASHRVHFFEVDLSHLLHQILERIPQGNQGVVLKRTMLKIADRLAQRWEIPALVTGEALGQVSSQTLTNLNAIDRASETVVLRPLASWDKPDIIEMARRIGVAELAASMPEFCAAISNNPNARVKLKQVQYDEQALDAEFFQHAVDTVKRFDIKDLIQELRDAGPRSALKCVNQHLTEQPRLQQTQRPASSRDVIIDIRPDARNRPLTSSTLPNAQSELQHIPYFKILNTFAQLDQSKNYFLYCDQGTMSGIQVEHLRARGFTNVHVWKQ